MGRVPGVCGLRHGGTSSVGIGGRPPLSSGARADGPGGCGREGPRAHQARQKKKEGRPPMIARGGGGDIPPGRCPHAGSRFSYRVFLLRFCFVLSGFYRVCSRFYPGFYGGGFLFFMVFIFYGGAGNLS